MLNCLNDDSVTQRGTIKWFFRVRPEQPSSVAGTAPKWLADQPDHPKLPNRNFKISEGVNGRAMKMVRKTHDGQGRQAD